MRAANRGGRKWYSEAYDNFKKKLVYNEAEERLMCATETQRHFYNEPGSRCLNNVISQAEKTEPEKMAALQRDLFSCTGGWPEGHVTYVTCWDMFHLCVLCP